MKFTPIGILKYGESVRDRPNSHLSQLMTPIIGEVLSKINPSGKDFIAEEIEMGRDVGLCNCVPVNDDDQIFYAQRAGRKGLSKFVRNRHPESCTKVSVILKKIFKDPDGCDYILITAYIGPLAGPEPWDRNSTDQSRRFWRNHALIPNEDSGIIESTETTICPW